MKSTFRNLIGQRFLAPRMAPCSTAYNPCKRKRFGIFLLYLGSGILLDGCSHRQPLPAPDGAALFTKKCASCHRPDNDMRAPEPEALHQMMASSILAALESGRMKWEAKSLSKEQKTAIADYLGAPNVSTAANITRVCARDLDPPPNPPVWPGWGGDPQNSRFQPTLAAGLTRGQIQNLKLKWSFGLPGAAATFGQPTSFAGKLFVGSEDGTVYALDSATGCLWWSFKASATVPNERCKERSDAYEHLPSITDSLRPARAGGVFIRGALA